MWNVFSFKTDILVFVRVYVKPIDRKIYATFYQDIIHGRDPVSFRQERKKACNVFFGKINKNAPEFNKYTKSFL